MKLLKKILFGTVCALSAGLVIGLVAPRSAHALVAALVQITNTTSNPVPTEEALGGAAVLEFDCIGGAAAGSVTFASNECFTVPAGKRAVVENVDGYCIVPPGQSVSLLTLTLSGNGSFVSHHVAVPFVAKAGTQDVFGVDHTVRYYADPGASFQLSGATTDASGSNFCLFHLTGRLVPVP